MNPLRRLAVAALTVALLAVFAAPLSAQAVKSDAKVKITADAGKPNADGQQVITLTLVIDKDWHLYANPVGLDLLTNAQTTVSVKGATPLKGVKVEYPKGKVKTVAGDTYSVYEDKAVIKAVVQRVPGDAEPLDVNVAIQACNDKSCLLPATVKLKVK